PSPQSVLYASPEIAPAVLVEVERPAAEEAVVSVALDFAVPNGAQPSNGERQSACPDHAFVILEDLEDVAPGQLCVRLELAILPACQSLRGADPERAVASGEQAEDLARRETLISWQLPGESPDAVEAKQAEFRPQPEVAIGRLRHGSDDALGEAVADLPGGMRILADVQRRIERERDGRRRDDTRQHEAQADGVATAAP